MKTRAAVLTGPHRDWEIVELDLDDPHPGEVLVRMEIAGLCHSDVHLRYGGVAYPTVGGHEGAGVVEAIGDGVTRVKVGEHVGASWIPTCGVCRWCLSGRSNLCDLGANMMTGQMARGGHRLSRDGEPVGATAGTGTYSQYAVMDERSVIPIEPDIPMEWISLATCGLATGWGSVVNAGKVSPGDTVAVYGSGGIGINAVRAAVAMDAALVAVIDPIEYKRTVAKQSGADLVFADAGSAQAEVWESTHGVGVDVAVVTTGSVTTQDIRAAFELVRKGGTIVLTGVSDDMAADTIQLPGSFLTLFQKRIVGALFGECRPLIDVPRLLAMARSGKLRLDDLVTRRYSLDDINRGFEDMLAGINIRGVVVHDH